MGKVRTRSFRNLITATLHKTTGEKLTLSIPETGSEIALGKALQFNMECLSLFEFLKEHWDNIESKKIEYLTKVIKCLNGFYEDIADFFELKSDVINIPEEKMQEHFEMLGKNLNFVQAHDTVIGIFNLIYAAVKDTKAGISEGFNYVEFKGSKFLIPEVWKDKLFERLNYKSISVKQAIEVLQIHNNYINSVKALNPQDENLVNYTYSKYLSELAILLLKEGETIPTDETEFKHFLSERMLFWQDIDLQTALNIEHWFEKYYNSLKEDPENYYYFNSKDPISKEEYEARRKAEEQNKQVFEKIGNKGIISRLIELGSFNGREKTNIESANTAPFTDAVKVISIDNSK